MLGQESAPTPGMSKRTSRPLGWWRLHHAGPLYEKAVYRPLSHRSRRSLVLVNAARLIRLISARSDAVARRVTQDLEGPFCPMKVGTARGFVTTDYQPPELRPNGLLAVSYTHLTLPTNREV